MSDDLCISCRRPKVSLKCEVCDGALCKNCAQFLEASTFSFLKKIPKELSHTHYCMACYDQHIAPALGSYLEVMERAKKVYVFFTTQRKHIPLLNRSKEKVFVKECKDRDETILRLAFLAAEQGYNAIIETEVNSTKIRNAGYQKSSWDGTGFPASVDDLKMERY